MEDIILKIKKLLALSDSSNEHESRVAMLKAQELLVKHKLSLKSVEEFETEKIKVEENVTEVTFRVAKWKAQLADIIANNFGCYIFFKTYRVRTIVFFGRYEDTTVCKIVLEYAIDCINNSVRKLKNSYRKKHISTKGIESDYALGFIEGLDSMFEKQKQKNEEWGLVLVKEQVVVDAYNNKEFRGSVDTCTSFQGHNDAFCKGLEDGEKFSITDKIANEGEPEEEILAIGEKCS